VFSINNEQRKLRRRNEMNQILVLTEKQYSDHPAGAVIARQGDVILFKPPGLVSLGKKIEDGEKNRVVLAHGEATGHAHAFYFEEAQAPEPKKAYELFECDASAHCDTLLPGRLLRLHERAFLRHEEHAPFSLPAGDYISVIQHEGDEKEELRRVAD
jgi:hypothetical protein